ILICSIAGNCLFSTHFFKSPINYFVGILVSPLWLLVLVGFPGWQVLDRLPVPKFAFFAYCIANFELGLCDIPLLFLVNKSDRGKTRPDKYG
ncbi:MAG: hypothetical protein PUE96_06445, partial [Oscillospiraceae bacterium]|nr:hypothetical protein [Oscillospiraceae bacterium]